MYTDSLIENINKIYREDPWIQQLFKGTGITLDNIQIKMKYLQEQFWFDSVSEQFLPYYEKLLDIKANPNNGIEDRRAFVEAKWKSSGKADLELIKAVCNSWKNGNVDVGFINGKIQLKFKGEYGIPSDLDSLLSAIDNVKPAHLALYYIFAFLLVQDLTNITVEELETHLIEEFAFA